MLVHSIQVEVYATARLARLPHQFTPHRGQFTLHPLVHPRRSSCKACKSGTFRYQLTISQDSWSAARCLALNNTPLTASEMCRWYCDTPHQRHMASAAQPLPLTHLAARCSSLLTPELNRFSSPSFSALADDWPHCTADIQQHHSFLSFFLWM